MEEACSFCNNKSLWTMSYLVTPYQARSICALLNFECSGSLSFEATYLNTSACPDCHEKVIQVEDLVNEWDTIRQKLKVLAQEVKNIISQGENRDSGTKSVLTQPNKIRRKTLRHLSSVVGQEINRYRSSFPEMDVMVSPEVDPLDDSYLDHSGPDISSSNSPFAECKVSYTVKIEPNAEENFAEASDLEKVNDPDWYPNDLLQPIHLEYKPRYKTRKTRGLRKKRELEIHHFSPIQLEVLTKQYEQHKDVLEKTSHDDCDTKVRDIWKSVAAAVSAVGQKQAADMCCVRLQPIIARAKQTEGYTYSTESSQGTVALKHLQVLIPRCDDERFKEEMILLKRRTTDRFYNFGTKFRLFRIAQKLHRNSIVKDLSARNKGEKCPQTDCRFVSNDPDHLAGHFRRKHEGDSHPYVCTVGSCGKKFVELRKLIAHKNKHNGVYPYPCGICDKKFTRPDSYNHHMAIRHTEQKETFPCTHCDRKFPTSRTLLAHNRYVHGPKIFKCPEKGCSASYTIKGALEYHLRSNHLDSFPHLRREQIMCSECGQTFNSNGSYNNHMRKHTGIPVNKPYACEYEGCSFRAERHPTLKYHVLIVHETKEKNFSCTQPGCGKAFKTNGHMTCHFKRRHMENTIKQSKFKCDQCNAELSTVANLKDHLKVRHTVGLKDVLCSQCGIGFPTRKNMMRHRRKHPNCKPKERGPNTVQCELCNASCSNLAGLKRHMHVRHTPDLRPWECEKCGQKFAIKMYLTRHMRESKSCHPKKLDSSESCPGYSGKGACEVLNESEYAGTITYSHFPESKTINVFSEGQGTKKNLHRTIESNVQNNTNHLTQTPSDEQQNFYYTMYGARHQ